MAVSVNAAARLLVTTLLGFLLLNPAMVFAQDDPFFILTAGYPNRVDAATYNDIVTGTSGPLDPQPTANLSWAQNGVDACDPRMETHSVWTFDPTKNVIVLEDIGGPGTDKIFVDCYKYGEVGSQINLMTITVLDKDTYLAMYAKWHDLKSMTFITSPNPNSNQAAACSPSGQGDRPVPVERNVWEPDPVDESDPNSPVLDFQGGEPGPDFVMPPEGVQITMRMRDDPKGLVDSADNVKLILAPHVPNGDYNPTGTAPAPEPDLTVVSGFAPTSTPPSTGPGGVGTPCTADTDCRSPIKCAGTAPNKVCGGCDTNSDCQWDNTISCVTNICGGCGGAGIDPCPQNAGTCPAPGGTSLQLCTGGDAGVPACRPGHCLNQPCSDDADCDMNLTCQGTTGSKTCKVPDSTGDQCDASNPCPDGQYCVASKCSQTPGDIGQGCVTPLDCKSGQSCSPTSHTCVSGGQGPGDPCSSTNPCINTSHCSDDNGGTCGPAAGGPGDPCSDTNVCVEGLSCREGEGGESVCSPGGGGSEPGGEGEQGGPCRAGEEGQPPTCNAGLDCVEGINICEAPCSVEKTCPSELYCVNGHCTDEGGDPDTICLDTKDCKSGLICVAAEGELVKHCKSPPCSVENPCPNDQFCVQNACSPTPGTEDQQCAKDSDCGTNLVCKPSGADPTKTTCQPSGPGGGDEGNDCSTTAPCKTGLFCVEEKCSTTPGTPGQECVKDSDCGSQLVCKLKEPTAEKTTCEPTDGGGPGGDCPCSAELFCVDSKCSETPGEPNSGCLVDHDCREPLKCNENKKCQQPPGNEGDSCEKDADCASPLTCVRGQCSKSTPPGGGEGDPCQSNQDCESPLICKDEVCTKTPGGGGGEGDQCYASSDCSYGLKCVRGKCKKQNGGGGGGGGSGGGKEGDQCSRNMDCSYGLSCEYNVCTKQRSPGQGGSGGNKPGSRGSTCKKTSDCSSGLSCVYNKCCSGESAPSSGGPSGPGQRGSSCKQTKDCSYGLTCVYNKCSEDSSPKGSGSSGPGHRPSGPGSSSSGPGSSPSGQGKPCKQNSDCSKGLTCNKGCCLSSGSEGAICRKNGDCKRSFNCVNGACVAKSSKSYPGKGAPPAGGNGKGSYPKSSPSKGYPAPAKQTHPSTPCTSTTYAPYQSGQQQHGAAPVGGHYSSMAYPTGDAKPQHNYKPGPIVTSVPDSPDKGGYDRNKMHLPMRNFWKGLDKCQTKTTSTVHFTCGSITASWTKVACATHAPFAKKPISTTTTAKHQRHKRTFHHLHHKRVEQEMMRRFHEDMEEQKRSVNEAGASHFLLKRCCSLGGVSISVPSVPKVISSISSAAAPVVTQGVSAVKSQAIPAITTAADAVANAVESLLSFSTSASIKNPIKSTATINFASEPTFQSKLTFGIEGYITVGVEIDIGLTGSILNKAAVNIQGDLSGGVHFDTYINGDVHVNLPIKCTQPPLLFAPYQLPGILSLGPYYQMCARMQLGATAQDYNIPLGIDWKVKPDTYIDIRHPDNSHAIGWKPDVTFQYPETGLNVRWSFTPLWGHNFGVTLLFGRSPFAKVNITAGITPNVGVGLSFEYTDNPNTNPLPDCEPPGNLEILPNFVVDVEAYAGAKILGNNIPIEDLYTDYQLYFTKVYFNPVCALDPKYLPPDITTSTDVTIPYPQPSSGTPNWSINGFPPQATNPPNDVNPLPTGSGNIVLNLANPSPDGTCGGLNMYSCGANPDNEDRRLCCSAEGWCGNTDAHCGIGCQRPFGSCDGFCNAP